MTIKCTWCGKFIGYDDFNKGASQKYTPDTHYSYEDYENLFIKCNINETG